MFQPLPSNDKLERILTTPDKVLRRDLKDICTDCGKVVYEGPNVEEGHARFLQHWKEEHGESTP